MQTINTILNKKEEIKMEENKLNIKQLMKEFKEVFHDKNQRPYKDEKYGTMMAGTLVFEHYIVYALIKGKDVEKVTHDVKSVRFLQAIDNLNGTGLYYNEFYKDKAYKIINTVFKSLSKEDYIELLIKLKKFK